MKFSENIQEIGLLAPDFMGFIFYEKSPRCFATEIPKINSAIKKTGVFVNASFTEIQEKVQKHGLEFIQLHGNETPEFCTTVERISEAKVINAFALGNDFDFSILEKYKDSCSYFLFDTKGQHFGGNGTAFDWNILENYALEKDYFLSGGIGIEDIEKLFEFFQKDYSKKCFAIDVNSRFETSPGLKDVAKLKQFIQQLKENHEHKL
ncbi:N-(5'-phosphoribosyl)anthranilate isomerase [compost metagenome]